MFFKKEIEVIFFRIKIICSTFILLTVLTLCIYMGFLHFNFTALPAQDSPEIKDEYDVTFLDDSPKSKWVKYGFELFQNTPNYIGPSVEQLDKVFSGNNLACGNCHLLAGTKPFAASLVGVVKRFPQYRGRENQMGSIQARINGCMERSMDGSILPTDSNEMTALVAYLEWIGRNAPKNGKVFGQGFMQINLPNRAVNLENGIEVYKAQCILCHGSEGKGIKKSKTNSYEYPPLWGPDSYNNGAGMSRVITAAQFIKGNMPYGVTYESPMLSDGDAYDVAGYINQQKRPIKVNLELDFPDLKRKPVSTPYPPYVDTFSISEHQLGPFQPIIAFYKQKFNLIKNK
jgi:thiosulfate dehydrogenase